jgi:hypothetical protein
MIQPFGLGRARGDDRTPRSGRGAMIKELKRLFGHTHEKDVIDGTDCFVRKMKTFKPPVSEALTRRVAECCQRSVRARRAATA